MSDYQMVNDLKHVANTCHLSLTPLTNWQGTAPKKARLFDMAYSAIKSQPEEYGKVLSMASELTVRNHHEFHIMLGVPAKVERLSAFCIPVNTLRRWMSNKPQTYLCAIIGIQQQIISEHCDHKLSSKLYKQAGLSYSELSSLILANPVAVKKLISVIQ